MHFFEFTFKFILIYECDHISTDDSARDTKQLSIKKIFISQKKYLVFLGKYLMINQIYFVWSKMSYYTNVCWSKIGPFNYLKTKFCEIRVSQCNDFNKSVWSKPKSHSPYNFGHNIITKISPES